MSDLLMVATTTMDIASAVVFNKNPRDTKLQPQLGNSIEATALSVY
jgi:hypothetical protein